MTEVMSQNHPFRDHAIKKLYELDLCDDETWIRNVEKSIFNKSITDYANLYQFMPSWDCAKFKQFYRQTFMRVHFNLNNPKNEELIPKLNTGEVTPDMLAFMTHAELWPEHWIGCEPGQKIIISQPSMELQESMLQCGKCKSKKIYHYEMQVRSADEPMTVFCTCLDCNKRWKM